MDKEIKELKDEMKAIHQIALENKKATKDNANDIKDNFDRINKNSFALEILKDYKKEARKWFIAFVIASVLLIIVCIHHFIIK